jgi:dGTPase
MRDVIEHVLGKEEASVNTSYAKLSTDSAGRARGGSAIPGDNRTAFAKDRDKILYSETFIKLSGKTQVFLSPRNPLISNRLTHTIMVAQLARSIARAIDANEDLVEAIALGHDLGHPPFGHQGEAVLNQLCEGIGGFNHNVQSLHMVDVVENGGKGLDLTREVREGILMHNGEVPTAEVRPSEPYEGDLAEMPLERIAGTPSTLEGCITRVCDRFAYVGKDIEDAIEAGIIGRTDIPESCRRELGSTNAEIIDTLVRDLITNFMVDLRAFREKNDRDPGVMEASLRLSPIVSEAMNNLIGGVNEKGEDFGFNYPRIYLSSQNRRYERHAETIIRALFAHFTKELDECSMAAQRTLESWAGSKVISKDQISLGDGPREVEERLKGGATVSELYAIADRYRGKGEELESAVVEEVVSQGVLRIVRDRCKEMDPSVGMSSIFTFLDGMTDEYVMGTGTVAKVRDHITSMTDEMAIAIFKKLYVPQPIV